jgi:hypothetical protein
MAQPVQELMETVSAYTSTSEGSADEEKEPEQGKR